MMTRRCSPDVHPSLPSSWGLLGPYKFTPCCSIGSPSHGILGVLLLVLHTPSHGILLLVLHTPSQHGILAVFLLVLHTPSQHGILAVLLLVLHTVSKMKMQPWIS